MTEDQTFDPRCRFGSTLWVAHRMGVSVDWLRSSRAHLEGLCFPKPLPMFPRHLRYLKGDVDAWIDRQSVFGDPETPETTNKEIDYDAL